MPVLVGTSGWQYRDSRRRFYPPRLPQRLCLEHHAAVFAATEVNNSFYPLPAQEMFEQWRARTPENEVITVKASRFLSHIKRLTEPDEPVARPMERVTPLDDRLGAVLLSCPRTCSPTPTSSTRASPAFPPHAHPVELRHDSWWNPDLRDMLTVRRAALVRVSARRICA